MSNHIDLPVIVGPAEGDMTDEDIAHYCRIYGKTLKNEVKNV